MALAHGQAERCLQLSGATTSLWKRTGSIMDVAWSEEVAQTQQSARDLLEPSAADAALGEGARMTFLEAISAGLDEPNPMGGVNPTRAPRAETAPRDENTFVREGEFWSVTYDGAVARLKDSKGLRDVARLLGRPGREMAAVDLAAEGRVAVTRRAMTVGQLGLGVESDLGEALDPEARAEYRARLSDLEEEVSEANANNDPERASRAREEREFLLAELGAAVGLGGRVRRVLDPSGACAESSYRTHSGCHQSPRGR